MENGKCHFTEGQLEKDNKLLKEVSEVKSSFNMLGMKYRTQ